MIKNEENERKHLSMWYTGNSLTKEIFFSLTMIYALLLAHQYAI